MEEINWEPNIKIIKEKELSEEEKKLAKLCSETELECIETIEMINRYAEQNMN